MNRDLAALVVKRCISDRICELAFRIRRATEHELTQDLPKLEIRQERERAIDWEIEIRLLESVLPYIDRLAKQGIFEESTEGRHRRRRSAHT